MSDYFNNFLLESPLISSFLTCIFLSFLVGLLIKMGRRNYDSSQAQSLQGHKMQDIIKHNNHGPEADPDRESEDPDRNYPMLLW